MRLDIHCQRISLSEEERNAVERRLHFALARFEPRLLRTAVYLSDQSGPHGGIGQRCRILMRLRRAGEVVVESDDVNRQAAVDRAADRAAQALTRELERRRDARNRPAP